MKIIPPEDVAALCERLHAAGTTIVFTHGVFDLVHPDLILQFREASKRGNHLIVALHTDDATERIYGGKRPLVRLSDRMELLAAMEMISYVTWIDEGSPADLIRAAKPDVIIDTEDDLSKIIDRILDLPTSST
jgi:bifunctional ADP-heptose synthase (sugar kinase/adenylyltransferase)